MPTITATTPTNFRKNLSAILEDVTETNMEVIIPLESGKNAVLISEAELNAIRETAYLMGTKANRERLDEAILQLENKAPDIKPKL